MSYKFFCNKDCEYFPCHKTNKPDDFNCLFCYCPLYMLGENCGGQFTYLPNGIKDCSGCILPHVKEKGYEHVAGKMKEVMKITQKNKECKDEDK